MKALYVTVLLMSSLFAAQSYADTYCKANFNGIKNLSRVKLLNKGYIPSKDSPITFSVANGHWDIVDTYLSPAFGELVFKTVHGKIAKIEMDGDALVVEQRDCGRDDRDNCEENLFSSLPKAKSLNRKYGHLLPDGICFKK